MLSGGGADSTKAKEAVEVSIALLGNAAIHFSMECRKSVMKHMNKDLRPLCERKFPKRGPHLGKILDQKQRNSRQHLGSKGYCYNGKRLFFSVRRLKQRKTAPEPPVCLGQECADLTEFSIQSSRSLEANLQVPEVQSGQQETINTPPHSLSLIHTIAQNRNQYALGPNPLPIPLQAQTSGQSLIPQ